MTMSLVQTITVGSGGISSIDFTSIPQTGTDLFVIGSVRNNNASVSTNINLWINGVSTGYTWMIAYGNGTLVNRSTSLGNADIDNGSTATASTFSNYEIHLPDYTSSAAKQIAITGVTGNAATSAQQTILAGSYSGTAAITSLTFRPAGTLFDQYTTISLYTITKGSGGATVS